MDRIEDSQQLDRWCSEWAAWHRSRRLFAPPIPQNILARMRPQPVREPPDAILSADMNYFNLALLSQPMSKGKLAFYMFYLHEIRPVKLIANELGFTTQAFYKALGKMRMDTYRSYRRMVYAETISVSASPVSEMTP